MAKASRVVGLWATKRSGMFVGTAKAGTKDFKGVTDGLDALISEIKKAKEQGVGITFMLFEVENPQEKSPVFNLLAGPDQRSEDTQGYSKRPIRPDPRPEPVWEPRPEAPKTSRARVAKSVEDDPFEL